MQAGAGGCRATHPLIHFFSHSTTHQEATVDQAMTNEEKKMQFCQGSLSLWPQELTTELTLVLKDAA
jgi:hypothetical protein